MALLDYKIVSLTHENRHVEVIVRVYRGSISTETEIDPDTKQSSGVTRYRRTATVRDYNLSYDVPRDMSRSEFISKARAYLNNKLISYATQRGHTVINEQLDVSEYEPVLNEIER